MRLAGLYGVTLLAHFLRIIVVGGDQAELWQGVIAISILGGGALLLAQTSFLLPLLSVIAAPVAVLSSFPLLPGSPSAASCALCPQFDGSIGWPVYLVLITQGCFLVWQTFGFPKTLLQVLIIGCLLGQIALLWISPKVCIFCLLIGLCLIVEWQTLLEPMQFQPIQGWARLWPIGIIVFGGYVSLAKLLAPQTTKFFGPALEGTQVSALIRGKTLNSRLIFLATRWCRACEEIPARLREASLTADIVYPCTTQKSDGCWNESIGLRIVPQTLVTDGSGRIVWQLPGLPSRNELERVKVEFNLDKRTK